MIFKSPAGKAGLFGNGQSLNFNIEIQAFYFDNSPKETFKIQGVVYIRQ